MRLKSDLTINGRVHRAGTAFPLRFIYPFFLLHMGIFGFSGFFMAYGRDDVPLGALYAHGGIAIAVYVVFYLAIFGLDEVRWMFINAALGLMGIRAEIDLILGWFGRSMHDFPVAVHVIPFLYYVLYTFLLRQVVIDLAGARHDAARRWRVHLVYVATSLVIYGAMLLSG